MFVDSVTITAKAGKGGNGAATFRRDAQTAKGGPDGGNGGNGGSIYIQGSKNLNDLRQFQYKKNITAENGIDGQRKNLYGKNAPNYTIYVPIGTEVTNLATHKTFEILNEISLKLIAKGGKGGRGNVEFKSAINRTPKFAEVGEKGEEKIIHLELKVIADIGLVGLPNTGKSSLLSVLTNAKPVIGNYPFTTLEPNIGMMETFTIADIPGLIQGASEGKGLGITFLKHIEKTKILVHCIDSMDEHPEESYRIVREEFGKYSKALLLKPEIIVFTRSDLIDTAKEIVKKNNALCVSIYNEKSIKNLKKYVTSRLVSVKT